MSTENDQRPADSLRQLATRLEWEYQPDRVVKRWRGYLRGYPDTTLVVLNLCDDRDDRCHMLGALMPDSAEREHTRCLVSWAKAASEGYLQDFIERLDAQPRSAALSESAARQNSSPREARERADRFAPANGSAPGLSRQNAAQPEPKTHTENEDSEN